MIFLNKNIINTDNSKKESMWHHEIKKNKNEEQKNILKLFTTNEFLTWASITQEMIGYVKEVKDDVVYITGLKGGAMAEQIEFIQSEKGLKGIINYLDNKDMVGATVLGDASLVKAGHLVIKINQLPIIKGGFNLLGRVVNPMGDFIDNKDKAKLYGTYDLLIEQEAPSIIERQPIKESLETGIKFIDAMIPIGCGQRELIIGDQKTGKTSIAVDSILNQKGLNVICIYVSIGQKKASIAKLTKLLEKKGCMNYTSIITANSADSSVLQYLAPYAGCALGEYFSDLGYKVLVIYDDLSKHAVAYRQMSLLLGKPSGREGYPGDVFYLHSRLLERAARLKDYTLDNLNVKAGSLTAFPVIETISGDVSAYIPTNVISITDGQIFLEASLFNRGIKPAISPGISVSRVGSAAQNKIIKSLSGSLKLELAQYREMEDFARLGLSLDEATVLLLENGARLQAIMNQSQYKPVSMLTQIILLNCGLRGLYKSIAVKHIADFGSRYNALLHHNKINVAFKNIIRFIMPENFIDFSVSILKGFFIRYLQYYNIANA